MKFSIPSLKKKIVYSKNNVTDMVGSYTPTRHCPCQHQTGMDNEKQAHGGKNNEDRQALMVIKMDKRPDSRTDKWTPNRHTD